MRRRFWAAATMMALLTAAKAPISLDEAGPKPVNYDKTARSWLEDNLRDFDSAKIEETRAPRRGYHTYLVGFVHKNSRPAWYVCYRVNAKNAYGGYAGWVTYMFAFQGEELLGAQSSESIDPTLTKAVANECGLDADGAASAS